MSVLTCQGCGKTDATVEMQPDPFQSDVWDDHTLVPLCPECAEKSAEEI